MILILTNKWDLTVDFVIRELHRRKHPFLRVNTEDLIAEKATITLPDLQILVSKQGKTFNLSKEIKVIWNRRPGKPYDDIPKNKRPSLAVQKFVNNQWYSWLEALQLLPGIIWINHPQNNDFMESKPRQLWLASKLGFNIPKTIITNDASDISEKFKEYGNVIAKALYSPLIEEEGQDYFIFTNLINETELIDVDSFKICPTIIQQPIIPKIDYRVTVIGSNIFPVKIISASKDTVDIDWRTQKENITFELSEIPSQIEYLCLSYVKEAGLLFGAIDLIEQDGKFIFIEINPNGEWGWLQKPNNIPIAETLCNLMVQIDGTNNDAEIN